MFCKMFFCIVKHARSFIVEYKILIEQIYMVHSLYCHLWNIFQFEKPSNTICSIYDSSFFFRVHVCFNRSCGFHITTQHLELQPEIDWNSEKVDLKMIISTTNICQLLKIFCKYFNARNCCGKKFSLFQKTPQNLGN